MSDARKTRRPAGRPPAGMKRGDKVEKVRGYRTLTLRVPPETRCMLTALSETKGLPMWQLVNEAVQAYFEGPFRTQTPRWYQTAFQRYQELLASNGIRN